MAGNGVANNNSTTYVKSSLSQPHGHRLIKHPVVSKSFSLVYAKVIHYHPFTHLLPSLPHCIVTIVPKTPLFHSPTFLTAPHLPHSA